MPSVGTRSFLTLSALTGLIGAFVYPLLSYFLIDELGVQPMFIGVYMVSVTLSGLMVSQFLGRRSDKGYSPRKMYMLANLGIILALAVYINIHWFAAVLAAGICFMAFGNASIPQMLTLSRQWANQRSIDITLFNAQIRASISFAWMLGPPIAFILVASMGFSGAFSIAMIAATLGILFVWLMIPEQPPAAPHDKSADSSKTPISF